MVAQGTAEEIMQIEESITGQYLSGKLRIPVPATRRTPNGWLKVCKAQENNLKKVNVEIPLGVLPKIYIKSHLPENFFRNRKLR